MVSCCFLMITIYKKQIRDLIFAKSLLFFLINDYHSKSTFHFFSTLDPEDDTKEHEPGTGVT